MIKHYVIASQLGKHCGSSSGQPKQRIERIFHAEGGTEVCSMYCELGGGLIRAVGQLNSGQLGVGEVRQAIGVKLISQRSRCVGTPGTLRFRA